MRHPALWVILDLGEEGKISFRAILQQKKGENGLRERKLPTFHREQTQLDSPSVAVNLRSSPFFNSNFNEIYGSQGQYFDPIS